jgi:hypothetical protein
VAVNLFLLITLLITNKMDDHTIHPALTKEDIAFGIFITPLDIQILTLEALIRPLKFS